MINLAVWRPDQELLHDLEKLPPDEYSLVARLTQAAQLPGTEFDLLLIPLVDFADTRPELLKLCPELAGRILTFKELWVQGTERAVTDWYLKKWGSEGELFRDARVLVLGGGSGIGKWCAKAFSMTGAQVVIGGRDRDKLADCANWCGNGKVVPLIWDITATARTTALIEEAEQLLGDKITVAVNSAGVIRKKSFLDIDEHDFDETLAVNLKGAYFFAQALVRYFLKHHIRGHLVNVSSVTGALPVLNPYGLSKWALNGLTYGLGMNFAEYGITVNGVAPTEVATPMQNWQEGDCPARRAQKTGRILYPCEVADMILFLTGPQGSAMPGQILRCNCGDESWGGVR